MIYSGSMLYATVENDGAGGLICAAVVSCAVAACAIEIWPVLKLTAMVVVLACAALELVDADPEEDDAVVLADAAAACAMLMYSTLPA